MKQIAQDVAADQRLPIPGLGTLPLFPASWYRFGTVSEIVDRPIAKNLLGKRLVAFRTSSGQVSVLSAACSHMGSDLGNGRVVDDMLECSFHHWRYGTDGRCVNMPCRTGEIPSKARQFSYPTQVRHGQIYFFFGAQPLFDLPFFVGEDPNTLTHWRVCTENVEIPWYMISINSVDLQHFRIAHDRFMIGEPLIEYPSPHVQHVNYLFEIGGSSLFDRFTRLAGGPQVRLDVMEWGGNIILAKATLKRAQSFGMLLLEPLDSQRTTAHIMIMARKSKSVFGRYVLDPLHTSIRTVLVRRFLQSDIPRLKGTYVRPHSLISEDQPVLDYMRRLCELPSGG